MKTKLLIFLIFSSTFLILNPLKAQMYWNHACQFAGTSGSYVAVPNSSTTNITGSFSIEAWINPSVLTGAAKGVISKGGLLGSALEYGIRINASRINLITNGATRLLSKTTSLISTNQWTHIAGTYNSATNQFAIYINGVIDTTSIVAGAAPPSNTDSMFVGISGNSTPFQGQIDEVRLWNKALSSPEVGQYFRTSLGATGGIYNGLIMSLTFQANHGLINFLSMVDQSGNGNDGFNRSVSVVNLTNRPSVTIMPNESVEFDGNEDYLASADDAVISPTTAITLEAWIFPRNSNQSVFITKGPDYTLGYNGSAIIWGINNTFISTGVGLPINQWSHMAFTYSASTNAYNFYLNGVLRAQNNFNLGNINDGTDSLYIGGAPGLPDLNGFLDEVRISNYAKSQHDINKYLYQSINFENEPNQSFANAVYNLDGLVTGSADGTPRLFFRNNARFSNPGAIPDQPISPLDRNDPSNFSNGYYITTSNKRIPESGTAGTTIDSTIVNFNSTITNVNLYVALNHKNSFSLEIVLVGPNGDSVKVFDNKNTTSTDENVITVFNDQADSSLINNRYATFSTVIKPENNMNSVFSGDNSQGRWKLIVRDEQANDIGFLYAWGIQFNNISQRTKDLNLTSIIQGFYNPGTDLMIPDTMRIYIHNNSAPFAIVDLSKALLSSTGLGLFSFSSTNLNNNQSYFIQLKHRNSIETWSNTFNFINNEAVYSFINSANAAFGDNQILVDNSPVRFAIYSGDVNQDGIIDLTDNQLIDNDANNFASGYVVTDVNGDNFVDINDAAIADNNAFNFVVRIIP